MRERIATTGVALALAGLLLLTAACGTVPATQYYSLDLPPAAAAAGKPRLDADAAVARFRAPQQLAQDRIVYRPGGQEVGYYNYHRWTGFPADMVTGIFSTELQRAGLFRGVGGMQSASKADYLVRGQILNLEEVNQGTELHARVTLQVDVLDAKTRALVWSGQGHSEQTVSERSVGGVVAALNAGVRQAVTQVIQGMSSGIRAK